MQGFTFAMRVASFLLFVINILFSSICFAGPCKEAYDLAKKGKPFYDKAIQLYLQSLEESDYCLGNGSSTWNNIAGLYIKLDRLDEALDAIRSGQQLAESECHWRSRELEILTKMAKYDEGLKLIQWFECSCIEKDDPFVITRISKFFLDKDNKYYNLDLGFEYAKRSIEVADNKIPPMEALAIAYAQQGDFLKATETMELIIAIMEKKWSNYPHYIKGFKDSLAALKGMKIPSWVL